MTRKDQIRNVYRTTGGRAGFHAFPDKEAAFPFVRADGVDHAGHQGVNG